MGREITLFKSEEKKTRTEVSDFLRQLAGKIDNGEVILKQGSEELALEIPTNVILDIKAEDEEKSRGTQQSLEIEIKWFPGDEDAGGDGKLELG